MRYRVEVAPIPGLRRSADIVFTKARVAVFIDGCFWHGCPEHGRFAFNHNADYWTAKIQANAARDSDTTARLRAAGWTVMRFWEHEETQAVVKAIYDSVKSNRADLTRTRRSSPTLDRRTCRLPGLDQGSD